ncbi:MAG: hypothetical protein ACRD12_00055, partial [Acidimicrobiales bacterium]
MSRRRHLLGAIPVVGAAIGALGAAAFACITPATISLSAAAGRPADVITVTGAAFRAPDNSPNPVQVRWNGVDGSVLAEVRPTPEGTFTTTVKIPDGAPGWYVITATLRDGSGEPVPGTPGRALFEIQGAAAAPVAAEPANTFTP